MPDNELTIQDAWQNLAMAVVTLQAREYRSALKECRKMGHWTPYAASIRRWFFTPWAGFLAGAELSDVVKRLEDEMGWDYEDQKPIKPNRKYRKTITIQR